MHISLCYDNQYALMQQQQITTIILLCIGRVQDIGIISVRSARHKGRYCGVDLGGKKECRNQSPEIYYISIRLTTVGKQVDGRRGPPLIHREGHTTGAVGRHYGNKLVRSPNLVLLECCTNNQNTGSGECLLLGDNLTEHFTLLVYASHGSMHPVLCIL